MNPSLCTEPSQLYGHSMHAGGWPKLGWQQAPQDEAEDVLTTHMLAQEGHTEDAAYV